jgi:hypothetical protein
MYWVTTWVLVLDFTVKNKDCELGLVKTIEVLACVKFNPLCSIKIVSFILKGVDIVWVVSIVGFE